MQPNNAENSEINEKNTNNILLSPFCKKVETLDEAKELLENPNITKVLFEIKGFVKFNTLEIANELAKNTNLSSLEWHSELEEWGPLVMILEKNRNIYDLKMKGLCFWTKQGGSELAHCLQSSSSLRSVQLKKEEKDTTVNPTSPEVNVSTVMLAIFANTHLDKLSIIGNHWLATSDLNKLTLNTNITSLSFKNVSFPYMRMLNTNTTIRKLSIVGNANLNPLICTSLEENNTLTELEIVECPDVKFPPFYLQRHSNLTILNGISQPERAKQFEERRKQISEVFKLFLVLYNRKDGNLVSRIPKDIYSTILLPSLLEPWSRSIGVNNRYMMHKFEYWRSHKYKPHCLPKQDSNGFKQPD